MLEIESLLSGSRWSMLKVLAEQPSSLQQLAEATNSTPANVSSQLKLLEAAGLIQKQRLKEASPGKPRVLYQLITPQVFFAHFSHSINKTLQPLSVTEDLLLYTLQLDIPDRIPLVQYIAKHKHIFDKVQGAIKHEGTTTTIVTSSQTKLPVYEYNIGKTKYTIKPKKTSSIDAYPMRFGPKGDLE